MLDNLRIVIEPDWRESNGVVHWELPDAMPAVLADPSGLLQALLNLVRNSHRAVQHSDRRELRISVSVKDQRARVRVEDSGPGVSAPESLFQPFQPGAEGTGLGLYVSRAVVRSYGGEMRFEPSHAARAFWSNCRWSKITLNRHQTMTSNLDNTETQTINLLLLDDHAMFRQGLVASAGKGTRD